MIHNLGGMHLLVILGIVVLLFGATKLPALARGIGQSINAFKKEVQPEEPPVSPLPVPGVGD